MSFSLPQINTFQKQFVTDPNKMYQLSEWLHENSYYSILHVHFIGDDADAQREAAKTRHEEFKKKFDEYMELYNDAIKAQAEHVQEQNKQDREIKSKQDNFTKEVSVIATAEVKRIISQASEELKSSMYYDAWVDHVRREIFKTLHIPL